MYDPWIYHIYIYGILMWSDLVPIEKGLDTLELKNLLTNLVNLLTFGKSIRIKTFVSLKGH